QNIVALAEARHDVDVANGEYVRDFTCEPKLLVGHAAGGDDRDVFSAELSELEGRVRDRALPIARHEFFSIGNLGLEDAVLGFEIFKVEPAVITHPAGIHVIVLARCLSINNILARADECVATSSGAGADACWFREK